MKAVAIRNVMMVDEIAMMVYGDARWDTVNSDTERTLDGVQRKDGTNRLVRDL